MAGYKDYSKEVLFTVGQRVHVELPEVPKEQRDVTTGIITKINTMFPTTLEFRTIRCTVRLDDKGNYVKEKFRASGGIKFEITCDQKRIELIK